MSPSCRCAIYGDKGSVVGNQFTECGMAYCVCGGWGEVVRCCGSSADRLFVDYLCEVV